MKSTLATADGSPITSSPGRGSAVLGGAGGVRERFLWAVRVRWLAIAGFLVLGGIAWITGVLLDPLPCVAAAVGASMLNIANQAAVRRWRLVAGVTVAAVLGDVGLITWLVVRTGGASSPFVAMYTVQVLAAAMLVEVRVALACAAAAVVALGIGVTLGSADAAVGRMALESRLFFPVWAAFFAYGLGLVSYVGGYVSEQLRRREGALEQSNQDLRATCERLEETERQLAQSEKMRALGDFVAGVVHELNNPTAIIAANLEILESEVGGEAEATMRAEAVREVLQDCREAAQRAGRIVSDLRQFSRGGGARRWADFDLNERVRRTVRLARHLFGGGVEIELDLHPLPSLRGVPTEIDQLLLNLLSNAAHALGEVGRVTVSTELGGDLSRRLASLRVADDGPGIPRDRVERIFEPFFTTREEGAGVGLGLSLAFAIAERHGGAIRVDTEVARGTCFEVVLPLDGPDAEVDASGGLVSTA